MLWLPSLLPTETSETRTPFLEKSTAASARGPFLKNRILSSILALTFAGLATSQAIPADETGHVPSISIPWERLGAEIATRSPVEKSSVQSLGKNQGALLDCPLQNLRGTVGPDGLRISDDSSNEKPARLWVKASSMGREYGEHTQLAERGQIEIDDQLVRWVRPSLVEELSVSALGIRQDFLIHKRPNGSGLLNLELEVAGAAITARAEGVELVLEDSGRKLIYTKLHVTDHSGRTLTAAFQESDPGTLIIAIDDRDAAYPIRVDPTFTDADWESMGTPGGGVTISKFQPGTVRAIAIDSDGDLYVGGGFNYAGGVPAKNIAKWDGNRWSALGEGVEGTVYALKFDQAGNLIVGGLFSSAGGNAASNIAKWDGTTWTKMADGMDGPVHALEVSQLGYIYAGGAFGMAGEQATSNIAQWNGVSWSPLGDGINSTVLTLAVDANLFLYAGGSFTTAGGAPANRIARWDPRFDQQIWAPLGTGISGGDVKSLAVNSTGLLYVGGRFTAAGGVAAGNFATWNGATWSAPPGMNAVITALAVNAADEVYAAGFFSMAGTTIAKGISRWKDGIWARLGTGIETSPGFAQALAIDPDGAVFVGGSITKAGGTVSIAKPVSGLAKWENSEWSTVGTGPDLPVKAVAFDSTGKLYAGGSFTMAGDAPANHIVQWDGSQWIPLGTGLNGPVHAIAVDSNDILYVGGQFTTAGGIPATNIATWDGTTWSALGGAGELIGSVLALAIDAQDRLYAGGTTASFGNIVRWGDEGWESLGSGVNLPVRALVIGPAGTVYAGGDFTSAGGQAANRIAAWDGSTWSALGRGTTQSVHALVIDAQGDLIAGGDFYSAGGRNAYGIARWGGLAWNTMGPEASSLSMIRSLVADPVGNIYVGGSGPLYMIPPGVSIAKWNGLRWSSQLSVGSREVSAMALGPDFSLWAGGSDISTKMNRLGHLGRTTSPFLLSPSGGERWQVGRIHPIVWNPTDSAVKLDFSIDNGAAWRPIEATYPGATGTYDWEVPNNPSRQTLVRITELAGGERVASSTAFDIADLDLTNLAADAIWQTGVPRSIEWTSATVEKINLEVLRTDVGETWTTIASSLPAELESYTWTPTPAPAAPLQIRVVDAFAGSEVHDTSAGIFGIKSLELTVFSEPQRLVTTSPYSLSWTSGGVRAVDLAYSKDGGASWLPIVTEAPARIPGSKTVGIYDWMVPFDPGTNYRLRVSDSDNPEILAESAALFSIAPHGLSLIGSPGSLSAGSIYKIQWNGEWTENVRLEYSMDGSEDWCPIVDTIPATTGEFDWLVPFDKMGSGFRIRITDLAYPLVTDESDLPFSIVLPTRFARLHGVSFFDQAPLPYLNVLFHAEDENNVGIDNLHPAELRISENGAVVSEAERIVLLKRRDQLDYTMKTVLMLDNSTSITAAEKPKVLDAARAFIRNKLPDQEIAIYYFSFDPIPLQGFTTDTPTLLAAINTLAGIPRVPSTNLWGAVLKGLDQWNNQYFLNSAMRGVVVEGTLVVLSDGDHNTDPRPISTVLNNTKGKRIITVGFGEPGTINAGVLRQLGKGGYYEGANADALEGLFLEIQENLVKFANSFYWLGYATPKRGPFVNTLGVGLGANTNRGPDAMIVEDFSSDGFTGFLIPGIVVNPTPLNPFGVNTLTIPSLGVEPVTIQSTFTFAAEPYEFNIASPDLLAIRPAESLFEHEFDASAFAGASTAVVIRDRVNGYEKTITVNFEAATPFALWAGSLGLAGAEASPSATPFGDSLPNLLRYAMGIGEVPAAGALPEIRLDSPPEGDQFVLAYQRSKRVPKMDLVPQFLEPTGQWADLPAANLSRVADRDADTEGWEVRLPIADFDNLLIRLEARVEP